MRLKIRNWSGAFENSESRKLKSLKWVAMPNRMHGQGYTALVDHPNGAAHLGAWCAIVEIASAREEREDRGILPQADGTIGGIARALGRISRLPGGIFEELLPRLLYEKEILWIEDIGVSSVESPDVPGKSPDVPAAKGRGGEGIVVEGRGNNVLSLPPSAERFISESACRMYELHPKKKHIALVPGALTSAVAMEADPKKKLEEIEAVHAAWCETYAWTEKNGNFAPPLAEWIADRGYTKWPRGREPTPKPTNVIPDRKWDLLGDMRRDAEARKAEEPDEETKAWYAKLDEEFMGKREVKSQ